MRTEDQMMTLIMEIAQRDARVRAVILNGSRANPNAPRDIFQDFDIVYIVTDVSPFRNNLEWIKRFGEMMILQMPEAMQNPPPENDGGFTYLMQFTDGNRVDLNLYPAAKIAEMGRDSLSVLLLDKDGLIEPFPPPSERDYLPQPPTAKAFADCCNEFWWVATYVAKGLWRQEILYAKSLLDDVCREQLMHMLTWHIGANSRYARNPGKLGRYFEQYLEPALWQTLQATFADAGYDHTWDAFLVMCDLFERIAVPLAAQYHLIYPHGDADRVKAHLAHVRRLPRTAPALY